LFDLSEQDGFFLCSSVEVSVMLQLKPIKTANFFPWYSVWIDAVLM